MRCNVTRYRWYFHFMVWMNCWYILFWSEIIKRHCNLTSVCFSGDPNDTFLRKVESTILIPNMIKKKANATWCQKLNERKFGWKWIHVLLSHYVYSIPSVEVSTVHITVADWISHYHFITGGANLVCHHNSHIAKLGLSNLLHKRIHVTGRPVCTQLKYKIFVIFLF